jgi:hypothetical protein
MSTPSFFSSRAGQWVIAGGIVLAIGVYLLKRFGGALANYTKDTPYAGAGAAGALGKVADDVSGGTLSSIGSAVGQTLYDWTHNDQTVEDVDRLLPVIFPDGSRRSISDRRVKLNRFEYGGATYTLQKDGTGQLYATAA